MQRDEVYGMNTVNYELAQAHVCLNCRLSHTKLFYTHAARQSGLLESQRIFSAEQIVVPADLPRILKEWTKEVIRANPESIVDFSAKYVGLYLSFLS